MSTNSIEQNPYPSDRTSLEAHRDPRAIFTEDRKVVFKGDRVYNYYDLVWGVIMSDPNSEGWFHFDGDDGFCRDLNGARISTFAPDLRRSEPGRYSGPA